MTNGTPNEGGYGYNEPSYDANGLPQYTPQDQSTFGFGDQALVQGNGGCSPVKAFGTSFRIYSKAVLPWILFTLLIGFVMSIAMTPLIINNIQETKEALQNIDPNNVDMMIESQQAARGFSLLALIGLILNVLIGAAVTVWGYNGALQVAEGRPFSFKQFFVLKHSFSNAYAVAAITSFISIIPSLVEMIVPSIILNVFLLIALIVISPMIFLATMYALDLGLGVGESFATSVNHCKRHWLKLVGFAIMVGVVIGLSCIPLGLGGLVTVPMAIIASALLYRQISGGVHVAYKD